MVLLSGNFLYAFVIALIYGIYIGITETVQRAVLPKYVDSSLRGTAYGLYNLVIGVGFFIGNILFGYLWDAYSLDVAIFSSSIFVASAMIGMTVFIKKLI
jgi:MFS family permease